MKAKQFERTVQAVTTAISRRHVLRFLSVLPFCGDLPSLLGDPAHVVSARKKHKHKHKKHKKTCTPQSMTRTCAGKCGIVQNNCQKAVDCGATHCPVCQACSGAACAPVADGTNCGGTNVCCNGRCCNGCCGSDGACVACPVCLEIGETCTPTTPETPNACCSGQCGCAGSDCTCRKATCHIIACGETADCCQGTCAVGISQCHA